MFDAIVFSSGDPEGATHTLATLVEGVVDGLMKRLTIIAHEPSQELEKLGEAVGCHILATNDPAVMQANLPAAISTDHILAVKAGALLPSGWPQMLRAEFKQRGMPGTAVATPFEPETRKERLKLMFNQVVKGRFTLDHGALLPRHVFFDGQYDGNSVKLLGPVQMSRLRVGRIGG